MSSTITTLRAQLSDLNGRFGGDAYLYSEAPLPLFVAFKEASSASAAALNADGRCMSLLDRSRGDLVELWRDIDQGLPAVFGRTCRGYMSNLSAQLESLAASVDAIEPGAGEPVRSLAEGIGNRQANRERVIGSPGDWWATTPLGVRVLIGGVGVLIVARLMGLDLTNIGTEAGAQLRRAGDAVSRRIS
jgi:hypothetical protein